jgi:hypothetical protein
VHLTSIHDANFATVLELGRRLGVPLPEPKDIHVFAVEVEDDRTFSERMSAPLETRFPACSAAILEQVRALLGAVHAGSDGGTGPETSIESRRAEQGESR